MTNWHDFYEKQDTAPPWPYDVDYEREREIETDVLVIGGGIAGCWAAISAARNGVRVALVEKGDTIRSGAGGPGCDHWCQCPGNPHSKVDPDEWAKGWPCTRGPWELPKGLPGFPMETASELRLRAAKTTTPSSNWSRWAANQGYR